MGIKSEAEVFAKIQTILDNIDPNKRSVVHVYKLKITQNGAVAKTMMLDLVNVKFYEGDEDAECTMIFDEETFADVVMKKVTTADALSAGKVKIEGDIELAKLLGTALSA